MCVWKVISGFRLRAMLIWPRFQLFQPCPEMRALAANGIESHFYGSKSAQERLFVTSDQFLDALRRSGHGTIVYFLRRGEPLTNILELLCKLRPSDCFGERLTIAE